MPLFEIWHVAKMFVPKIDLNNIEQHILQGARLRLFFFS